MKRLLSKTKLTEFFFNLTPISRRSKPSSRSLLMGVQPHPWEFCASDLLRDTPYVRSQDRKSRHRGSKPRGRYGLSPVTTLFGGTDRDDFPVGHKLYNLIFSRFSGCRIGIVIANSRIVSRPVMYS